MSYILISLHDSMCLSFVLNLSPLKNENIELNEEIGSIDD
jgi:hypothetical protein